MRRIFVMIMLLTLVLNVGCNDKTSNTDEEQITTTASGASETIDGEATDNEQDDVNTEVTEDETAVEDENLNSDESVQVVIEETEDDDLVEVDAYPSVTEPIVFDPELFDESESEEIVDEAFINDVESYLSDFYYNYYFHTYLEEETGIVTSQAMELFALSYIMQNENEELKFDVDTFRLYIPVKQVRAVVAKFFHRNLDVHNSYEDLLIEYDNDVYSIVVEDGTWDLELSITSVLKMGDFSYRVYADVIDTNYEVVRERIEAVIDETSDGLLIINYHKEEVEVMDADE